MAGIKSKGYNVEQLPAVQLTVNVAQAQKQITAQELSISGGDNPSFQNYAYVVEEGSYTSIQLSCPKESDFPSTKTALTAIEVTP